MLLRFPARICSPCLRHNVSTVSRSALPAYPFTFHSCRLLSPGPLRSFYSARFLSRTVPPTSSPTPSTPPPTPKHAEKQPALRENIYTIPNLLTVSRMVACPVLGLAIVNENFYLATGLLVYAGLTDLVPLPSFTCTMNAPA